MQPRWLRPVAALTLALLAALFLAATAIAAQSGVTILSASEHRVVDHTATGHTFTWIGTTNAPKRQPSKAVAEAKRQPLRTSDISGSPTEVSNPLTWIWPGDGPITSSFGRRWGRLHAGVDIDAAYGSSVVAAQRGTVIAAGWGQSGYGQVVEIDHGNGITSLYAHLSAVSMSVGQQIARGSEIGKVGKTGSVTAAHLHYEVHVADVPRNPAPWLTSPDHSLQGNPG